MKFAIRDDDLNWFFKPEFIQNQLSDIWDICPVSMSVIPHVLGNWIQNTYLLEKYGSNNTPKSLIDSIIADRKVYSIGDNTELVHYIKEKIKEKKIYLTMHGINHRNNDSNLPNIKNNFSIGAEFYTNRNLEDKLLHARNYLEEVFSQKISVFTPPQNALSKRGMNAVQNTGLNICGDIPSLRNYGFYMDQIGFISFLKVFYHRLFSSKGMPFPKVLDMNKTKITDHCRIQLKTDLDNVKLKLEHAYKNKGHFVLSTHSYGFEQKMEKYNLTLKEGVLEIIEFAEKLPDVNFVSINEVF